ncbi:MAG: hypothetical protein ACREDY_13465 [Bradyrhizobium sp.]
MSIDLLMELTAFETEYWHEVDRNWGREAHSYYREDGAFVIGDKRMDGPKGVADFYGWRQERGQRTARHLVSNFRLTIASGDHAIIECVMCLYAADGIPVLDSKPAILIADVTSECVKESDGKWRYALHHLKPIFMGGVSPTLPPER